MIVCIGGMPGSGKSTVAARLANQLEAEFMESDDLLPNEYKPKIAAGTRLTETELDHWICDDVIATAVEIEKIKPVVLAALLARPRYELLLKEKATQAVYINLAAPYEILKARVENRDHFATTKTLDFCWEFRDEILFAEHQVDATQSLDAVVNDCLQIIKTLPDI